MRQIHWKLIAVIGSKQLPKSSLNGTRCQKVKEMHWFRSRIIYKTFKNMQFLPCVPQLLLHKYMKPHEPLLHVLSEVRSVYKEQ